MTQLKHTIIYLVILSILCLVISYAISVNMEIGFCVINSRFISNNFLFTCFSGAFASILVLIATEVYRFIQTKKSIEQFLFSQLAFIYGQLQAANTNITNILNNKGLVVDSLLSSFSNTIKQITPSLRLLDYNPFFSSNRSRAIKRIITRLFSTEINQLDSLSSDCIYLPMAICTDKLDALSRRESDAVITSISPNTQKTLNVLNKEIIRLTEQILIDLTELNTACDNSFHWNDVEKKLSDVPMPDTSLSAFFSKYESSK